MRRDVDVSTGRRGWEKTEGYWRLAWRRFSRHQLAVLGSGLLVVLITLTFVGSLLVPESWVFQSDVTSIARSPSLAHLMGTDEVGRDLLARIIYGGRISLTIAFVSVSVAISVGLAIGGVSGYYRGAVDGVLMRFTDVMMSIPSFFGLIVLTVVFGPSVPNLIVAIGGLHWMTTARIVRACFLSCQNEDYVLAARCVGARDGAIMWRHILPNTLSPIVVSATLGVAAAIMIESAVSYLGLGVQAPTPSWGNMLRNAQDEMWRAPWVAVFPGLAILLTVLSINFVGDALRDAFDPRSRRG